MVLTNVVVNCSFCSMVALSEHANPLSFELSRVWEGRSASLSLVSRHSISRGFTWFSRRYELSNTVIWLLISVKIRQLYISVHSFCRIASTHA